MISKNNQIKYIDLFCGIGGFRFAIEQIVNEFGMSARCVLSSDIDNECRRAYEANFGERPHGDITGIHEMLIPDHDFLLAGFPCQPFSICGDKKGFKDTRGTLFFDIARILKEKKPDFFVLENVKMLKNHDKGRTLSTILSTLTEIGYYPHCNILNALDFGLPQKRERMIIVGFKENYFFNWPKPDKNMISLDDLLEKDIPEKHFASEHIRKRRLKKHEPTKNTTIWHENKAGNVSTYPYSCALRASASYNYLLVNGERRLTPREMLRLQGFPEEFKIVCSDYQTRKQCGNAVPVNMVAAVLKQIFITFISNSKRKEYTLAEA